MPSFSFSSNHCVSVFAIALIGVLGFLFDLSFAHQSHIHHHHCNHGHDHHHHHHHHGEEEKEEVSFNVRSKLLPEEIAEEEDMKLYGFGAYSDHDHDHDHDGFGSSDLSGLGLWIRALGCSFLVSMASLICLIILPVIFVQGKPSKAVVDSLALFGAGAMLGDAFLHQLPHAFGGKHSHSHASESDHHDHSGHEHSHAHSLEDLSVGISVLAGIVLFLLVEKIVRYVDDNSGGGNGWSHGHHHHHQQNSKKLKDDSDSHNTADKRSGRLEMDDVKNDSKEDKVTHHKSAPRKRNGKAASRDEKQDIDAANGSTADIITAHEKSPPALSSNLVFGYLNLFSDGVHNFTDGMALGSAFLLHGSVGGWSRTLFLLAHELPQEIGDFGILVRSGFSVTKALFFNFLSALVALAGTAMALLMGKDPGHSSLIEGLTAGGFIYIAVAGVLAEMNNSSKSTLRSTAFQLTSLVLGMAVALGISLVE